MWQRRGCGCKRRWNGSLGLILISLGLGIFLARVIPYYLLIILFGCSLIVMGIRYLLRK